MQPDFKYHLEVGIQYKSIPNDMSGAFSSSIMSTMGLVYNNASADNY